MKRRETFTIHSVLEAEDIIHAIETRQEELKMKLSKTGGGKASREYDNEIRRLAKTKMALAKIKDINSDFYTGCDDSRGYN